MAKKKGRTTKRWWHIGKDRICIITMVALLTVSALGYMTTAILKRGATPEEEIIPVRVAVDFGEYERVLEIVNATNGSSAEDAFEQVANVSIDIITDDITSITVGNQTAEIEGTKTWVFYVNGGLKFERIQEYYVEYGDLVELRYEEKPY